MNRFIQTGSQGAECCISASTLFLPHLHWPSSERPKTYPDTNILDLELYDSSEATTSRGRELNLDNDSIKRTLDQVLFQLTITLAFFIELSMVS